MRDVDKELFGGLARFVRGRIDEVKALVADLSGRVERNHESAAAKIAGLEMRIADIPAGKDGAPGRDGIDGKDGAAGANGRDGIDGKDGAPGRDGIDGKDGRDALELDVIEIDPKKSYARGTVASYAGGLIKAERRTSPINGRLSDAGWRVILRGVAQTELVERDDRRTLAVRLTHTDGEVVEHEIRSQAIIYREIYQEGTEYVGGDAVTWAGSLWIALRATASKPGDGSPDWRLAVKKGRDGRDAK